MPRLTEEEALAVLRDLNAAGEPTFEEGFEWVPGQFPVPAEDFSYELAHLEMGELVADHHVDL